jgi:hypothetical protein
MSALPTASDVRDMIYAWYRLLDGHVDVKEYLPYLHPSRLKMVFPEATLQGVDAYRAWYMGGVPKFDLPGVINIFFDEVHELKRIDITLAGTDDPATWQADVLIVVKWEARRWKPPAPKSEYLGFDAWQRWVLTLSPQGKPVVEQYIVEKLEKLQGSVDL